MRVRELLGQGARLKVPTQPLVRIAEAPQDMGEIGQTLYPWRDIIADSERLLLLGNGKGDALLQVRTGGNKRAQEVQGCP
jgi:hypothetical protein